MLLAIKSTLGALTTQPAAPTGDAMRYGKRSDGCLHPCAVEMGWHDDALHATLMVGGHVCDLLVSLRYADLRIGVFLPNAVVRVFDEDPSDTLSLMLPSIPDGTNSRCVRLARRGFDCYPRLNEPGWPHVLAQPQPHGLLAEFCFSGTSLGASVDEALRGQTDEAAISEAVAMQAAHILRALSARIYAAEMRQREARGLLQRLEFTHQSTSDELVRHYGLDPVELEIIQEALDGRPGRYAIYLDARSASDMEHKLAEVRESALDFDTLPNGFY